MAKSNVIIIIPLSFSGFNNLSEYEWISLRQAKKVFWNRTICFLTPIGLKVNIPNELKPAMIKELDTKYFGSLESHSLLLLSMDFYNIFDKYEYILLYHPDAFVFRDDLDYFCSLKYDYIAAPHFPRTINNPGSFMDSKIYDGLYGGFSLRKVKAFSNACKQYRLAIESWRHNEDIFYSVLAQNSNIIKKAPLCIARKFALEERLRRFYRLNKQTMAMGIHGWWKFDLPFLRPFIEEAGYKLEGQVDTLNQYDYIAERDRIKNIVLRRFDSCTYLSKTLQDIVQKLTSGRDTIILWGIGQSGGKYIKILNNICKIRFIYDINPNKQGTQIEGIPILQPNEKQLTDGKTFVFLSVGVAYKELTVYLCKLGLKENHDFVDIGQFVDAVVSDFVAKKIRKRMSL